jgi:hypothetical protein
MNSYLDNMVEELGDSLADRGCLDLVNLTDKYQLPLVVMRQAVKDRLSMLADGCSLDNNLIKTNSFADRELAKVRGIFRACTRPISMSTLATRYKFDELKLKAFAD